jgi:hypothetical protein
MFFCEFDAFLGGNGVANVNATEKPTDIRAGEQPSTLPDERKEWQTPRVILAKTSLTDHASTGGSDGGVFPAPDSAS